MTIIHCKDCGTEIEAGTSGRKLRCKACAKVAIRKQQTEHKRRYRQGKRQSDAGDLGRMQYECTYYPGWPDDDTAFAPGSRWMRKDLIELSKIVDIVVVNGEPMPIRGIARGATFRHLQTKTVLVF